MNKHTYYYFSTTEKKLGFGDNRHIRTGRTHKVKPPIKLCSYGLHASKRPIDALQYAPGPYLWLVSLSGKVVHGKDKAVATERTYLKGFNAGKLLYKFARKQALINIEKIKPYCSDEEYSVIVEWLYTGSESLRSFAESAANSTTWSINPTQSAAESAAQYAAQSAAGSAANSAAKYAAWSAAQHAAESAARSAARSFAWSINPAARSAAESATRSAWSAANDMLLEMIREYL